MKCPLCKDGCIIPTDGEITAHLIVAQRADGEIHVHMPENPAILAQLMAAVKREVAKNQYAEPIIQTNESK